MMWKLFISVGGMNLWWGSLLGGLFLQSRTTVITGSHNFDNHTVITVFWRNCLGKWSHLLGSLWVFYIWKEKPCLQHFYLGKYDLMTFTWVFRGYFFLFAMYFECVFETLHDLYIIYSEENKNFVKKNKCINHLTFL